VEEGTTQITEGPVHISYTVTPQILLVYCNPGRGKRKRKK
jgi:hypothetical protein